MGYGGAVDFAAEQGSKHDVYSKILKGADYTRLMGFRLPLRMGQPA
ncbi:hypothetical protein GCWU000324_00230 [Kingella oralis ATCC 51147]|uniref:Uncharacterized protein n=1 Tax=Kingella oralis ATCC 51147 TaxID=629741 RepID=C4GH99_9NEIS|nr:hypothetical protein GCWU000324_00230 [Kingella oralis ATCC 51147]